MYIRKCKNRNQRGAFVSQRTHLISAYLCFRLNICASRGSMSLWCVDGCPCVCVCANVFPLTCVKECGGLSNTQNTKILLYYIHIYIVYSTKARYIGNRRLTFVWMRKVWICAVLGEGVTTNANRAGFSWSQRIRRWAQWRLYVYAIDKIKYISIVRRF